MSDPASARQRNQELARRLNDAARHDPNAPYAGKFVGIADGRVVVAADDLDELVCRLGESGTDPGDAFCLEVGLDYDAVQEIWGAR